MKKVIALLALITVFASSCKKEKEIPTNLTGYFYTSDASGSEAPLLLYVDGELKGNLPNLNIKFSEFPSLSETNFTQKALKLSMLSGTYNIEMRNSAGRTLSQAEAYFKFYKNKKTAGVKGLVGGSSSEYKDYVFSFGIYE